MDWDGLKLLEYCNRLDPSQKVNGLTILYSPPNWGTKGLDCIKMYSTSCNNKKTGKYIHIRFSIIFRWIIGKDREQWSLVLSHCLADQSFCWNFSPSFAGDLQKLMKTPPAWENALKVCSYFVLPSEMRTPCWYGIFNSIEGLSGQSGGAEGVAVPGNNTFGNILP